MIGRFCTISISTERKTELLGDSRHEMWKERPTNEDKWFATRASYRGIRWCRDAIGVKNVRGLRRCLAVSGATQTA